MKYALVTFLLFTAVLHIVAQDSFVEKQVLLFSESPEPKSVFIADLNGDNFSEVVYDGWNINDSGYFPNLGDGNFDKTIKLPMLGGGIIGIADFDDDGDQDILCVRTSGGFLLARNNGVADFTDTLHLAYDAFAYHSTISDVDNNGLPDILLGRADELRILYNQGNLNFTPQDVPIPGPGRDVLVADLDGNGLKDVVVRTNVYFQHTLGNFTEVNLFLTYPYESIAVADFSGDGKLDIFYALYGNEIGNLFLGMGYFESSSDGFQSQVLLESGRPLIISSADIDNDGDLDLFNAFPQNYNNDEVLWIENKGDNIIEYGDIDLNGQIWTSVSRYFIVPGDLNNDGSIDLVVGEQFKDDLSWLENTPGHSFDNRATIAARCLNARHTFSEDFNADLKKDVLTYCPEDRLVAVCYQDSNGMFDEPITLFESESEINHLEVYDIDKDGNSDIVYSTSEELSYRLNLGNGNFSMATSFSLDNDVITFEQFSLGDMNENNWADLVTRDSDNGGIVYVDFASSQSNTIDIPDSDFLNTSASYHIHDLDKDGLKDIAIILSNTINPSNFLYIFKQSSSSTFSIVSSTQLLADEILQAEFTDVNGDGFLDFVVLYQSSLPFSSTRLKTYSNDGFFSFDEQPEEFNIPFNSEQWTSNDIFDIAIESIIFSENDNLQMVKEQEETFQFDILATHSDDIKEFVLDDISSDGRDDILLIDERQIVYFQQVIVPPVANFEYDDCTGTFINASSGNYLDGSFHWDFGNGYEETSFSPSAFPFDELGTYVASLVACTAEQCDTFEQVLEHTHFFDDTIPSQGLVSEAISFENESTGFSNFTWVFGDGNVSIEQSPIHTYTAPGYYPVEFFATDNTLVNCTRVAADTLLIDWPTGIVTTAPKDIRVSPNPFSDGTMIFSPFDNWTYTVYDAYGDLIQRGKCSGSNFYLEKNNWSAGMYILKVESLGYQPVVKKLMVTD